MYVLGGREGQAMHRALHLGTGSVNMPIVRPSDRVQTNFLLCLQYRCPRKQNRKNKVGTVEPRSRPRRVGPHPSGREPNGRLHGHRR